MKFLRIKKVAEKVGISPSTIYRKINAGTFPKSKTIGANTVIWLESDVEEWMQKQIQGDLMQETK